MDTTPYTTDLRIAPLAVFDSVPERGPTTRFMVPEGDEWSGYIDEHRDFSGVNDAHDDQVDWTAHAFNIGSRLAGSDPADILRSLPVSVATRQERNPGPAAGSS